MPHRIEDFPFEEIRQESGDLFASIEECKLAGFKENQIWSIISDDDFWVYGPSQHYVNLLGYVCTNEEHDGDTYYEENIQVD